MSKIMRDYFSKEVFWRTVRHYEDCKDVYCNIVRKSLAEHIFEKKTAQTRKCNFGSIIHVRNVLEVLKIQMRYADR